MSELFLPALNWLNNCTKAKITAHLLKQNNKILGQFRYTRNMYAYWMYTSQFQNPWHEMNNVYFNVWIYNYCW